MSEQAKFLEGNLFRHISVMSGAAAVAVLAIFLVDFVDMLFISMLGRAELAAAVGYSGAIMFFTTSMGIGVGIAAGALVANSSGSGDEQGASRRAATSLIYSVAFSAVFALVMWVYLDPIARLVGATGETLELAVDYLAIVVPSLPFLVAGIVGSAILRAHGAAKKSMMVTIAGGAVNAVLDPILIFGLDLQLTGAALATVIARVVIAVAALYYIQRDHGGLVRPTWDQLKSDFPALVVIAAPATLTQLATPVAQGYVTRAMAEFGESAVAGMAIVGRLTPVAFAMIFALSGAIGPIVGQNYGADKMDRVITAYRESLLFTVGVTLATAAILFLLRAPIADLFEAEGVARELVYLFCGPLALLFFFNGAIFVANAVFNNLGHPFYSTWVNWGRHTVGTIPFVILFASWYGAAGVLIGQAVGGIFFGIWAIWLGARVVRAPADSSGHWAHHGGFHTLLFQVLHFRR
jgi:putative MATE family efflux protein